MVELRGVALICILIYLFAKTRPNLRYWSTQLFLNIRNLRKRRLPCSKPQKFGSLVHSFRIRFFFFIYCLFSHLESCAENLDEASRVLRFLSSFILLCFLQSDSNHIGQSGLDLRMERQHLFIFLDFHAISARLFVIFFLFLYFCYPNATVGVVASVCIYVYVKKTKMHLCYKTPDEKR